MQRKPTSTKNAGTTGQRTVSASKQAPHQVRIIGGQWKRTPLPVLDAEGLRPTPDRVRETVFNWLNHLFDGDWQSRHCLDLFAGSGALGFEAASRGAASVAMVESNPAAVRHLETIRAKLNAGQVRIMRGDALAAIQRMVHPSPDGTQKFDLIFLDPPYHQGWLDKMLPVCAQLLSKNGLVYAEAEGRLETHGAQEWMQQWEVVRADKAGVVFYHLLKSIKNA